MVDAPIMMAQSQERTINIQKGPEEAVRDAFLEEWKQINADRYIANTRRLSRIYGVSALAVKVKDQKDDAEIQYEKLAGKDISFSVFDPLNIAGSVVLSWRQSRIASPFDIGQAIPIIRGWPICIQITHL
jgi:hypothetical protein